MPSRRQRDWFGGLALACSLIGALVSSPAHASGDWENSWQDAGGGYLADYFPLGLRLKQPAAQGAKKWAVVAHVRFRGERLSRAWREFPDGTLARVRGNTLRFRKPGEVYLTQVPVFSHTTITWRARDYRRPLPITGSLRVTYDIFEKTVGQRPRWVCSVYDHEVCRWRAGRQSVPKHRVAGASLTATIYTDIGPDKFAGKRPTNESGSWCGLLTDIPQDLMNNPLYPVRAVYDTSDDEYECSGGDGVYRMYSSDGLDNHATVKWRRTWNYTK